MKHEIPMFEYTEEGFEKIRTIMTKVFFEKLIPRLKEVLDLKFLDSTINNKVEYLGGNTSDYFLSGLGILFRRMILAKLTNNPLYEHICEFNASIVTRINAIPEGSRDDYQKNFPNVFDIVYERLKDEKPLNNLKLSLKSIHV